MTEGIVNIHGKEYQTVAYRVHKFREENPNHTIETQLITQDDEKVIMKALILDGDKLLATGYAEEIRDASHINKTSALEVAETSAIGRALAALGLAGTEYASADEVAGAISQQKIKEALGYIVAHNDAWKRHKDSIYAIQGFVDEQNLAAAWEAWNEIPEDDRKALKIAPTKGGWMRKEDKEALAQAAKEDFDPERGVYRSIADKRTQHD